MVLQCSDIMLRGLFVLLAVTDKTQMRDQNLSGFSSVLEPAYTMMLAANVD